MCTTKDRRAVFERIRQRVRRDRRRAQQERGRRETEERQAPYAATRAAWMADYANAHPDAVGDEWRIWAAWMAHEGRTPPGYGPSRQRVEPSPDGRVTREDLLAVIAAGRKALARTLHPDAGGDADKMIRTNRAADELEALIAGR